jgi:lysozyme family protein
MSVFSPAFNDVKRHEGGRVNHPKDRGGSTAFGLSLRFMKGLPGLAGDVDGDGHVNADDIAALTVEKARHFYKAYFWDHYRLEQIQDQGIATKLFNFFVNMRGKTAALVAQRAANDLGANLVTDGVMGSRSIKAINALEPAALLCCIQWRAWEVYRAIIANDPEQSVFEDGWQARAFAGV